VINTAGSQTPFHSDLLQNYDFSLLKKKTVDTISDTSLKYQFPGKLYMEYSLDIGEEFPHLSTKPLNILLPLTTSYLCETGFSAIAATNQSTVLG
jgi:hypothetical protein